ncbi:MAG: Na+/H+ antiporter subunit G [Paracoccaceae bacterium]
MFEYFVAIFLVIAGGFGLVGSIGLIKLGDPMSRLHAPTKATTLGVGGVLIASMLHALLIEQHFSVHELLITLFLFITAPVTANFIAKAHIHRHCDAEDLPDPSPDARWAGLTEEEASVDALQATRPSSLSEERS